jgi:hypothetical protein
MLHTNLRPSIVSQDMHTSLSRLDITATSSLGAIKIVQIVVSRWVASLFTCCIHTILLIALDQSHRAIILMPSLSNIINHSYEQHTREYNTRPIHRFCCHRRSDRPERKEPERQDEANCYNVDGKSKSAKRPPTRRKRRAVQPSPDQRADHNQVGAEDGNRAERRDRS